MFTRKNLTLFLVSILAVSILLLSGCAQQEGGLSGEVLIDGSSTVYPVTQAVAEEFMKEYPGVRASVGVSGTGGGFEKYTIGEIDINDASRKMKDSERELAQENGIETMRATVAYDGISIIIHPDNDWAKSMTVEELNKIWKPGSNVKKWSDIRPEWPDKEIDLYAPGSDSGTFHYFTEAINHEEGASRADYTASENDNVLIQGVSGNKYALGYLGYAYYKENKEKLNTVAIDDGDGEAVQPTVETIGNGSYKPLSRGLYFYVSKNSLKDKEAVEKFVEFYMNNARDIVPQVGYVPLSQEKYQTQLDKFNKAIK
ncbi:PstS family phosphate ABC transporter substrate-binding protein [Halanaerocella petrolearia]